MPIHGQIPEEDIPTAKGMLLRYLRNKEAGLPHEDQHDIAWWFGVNNGRVNELLKLSTAYAQRFADVPPAPEEELPPPGPYPSAREFMRRLSSNPDFIVTKNGVAIAIPTSHDEDNCLDSYYLDQIDELEELLDAANANVVNLHTELENTKNQLVQSLIHHARICDELEAEHDKAIAELEAEHDKAIAELEAERDQALTKLQRVTEAVRTIIDLTGQGY